jgi:hypothetical protein
MEIRWLIMETIWFSIIEIKQLLDPLNLPQSNKANPRWDRIYLRVIIKMDSLMASPRPNLNNNS